jgi:hypothetical protein
MSLRETRREAGEMGQAGANAINYLISETFWKEWFA